MNHLETKNILTGQQHGFRKHRSCETQLLEFIEEVSTAMERGTTTEAVVLDFAKAFDRVNHSLLCHKLYHYGIRGKTNSLIANFLSGRTQSVVVDGVQSSFVKVKTGVPQGSVLGPCLFLCYINDLPSKISSPSRLFADDTAVYRFITCAEDPAKLQEDLQRLEQWEKEWDMAFHPDKYCVLPFTRSHSPPLSNYTLHGQTLERVTSTKYLGVILDTKLDFTRHIENICAKANKTLGFLRRNLKVCSSLTKMLAYKTMVRPILEYACTEWDPHSDRLITTLEKVQRRAARFVTNRYHNTTSVTDMLTLLEWPTLQQRRRCARLAMLHKILNDQACVSCVGLKRQPRSGRRSNHSQQLGKIPCRTDYRKFSFFPRTTVDWNSLPSDVVEAPSYNAFCLRAMRAIQVQ
ncbi:hypothetical protein V1264_014752 [Littorina saxatilis]|uniref:Reverse transcriptase domain-containing protein n=1 Tax=Littorina saxatilis TaxID=31220 RepID=A0AAN9BRX9_9CAEN